MTPAAPQRRRPRAAGAQETFVIIGAGQAGAQAAITMREHGFRGRVVVIGEESQPPYQRPPLSKRFLENLVSVERLYLRPLAFYEAHGIELKLHAVVEKIDRGAARVHLQGGPRIAYDKLLIATGCRPRMLDLPGGHASDIHYLRSLQDALRIRSKLGRDRRLAVIGGGYIGLEVAATARSAGARVTVLESAECLLKRVTTQRVSDFFARTHRAKGVEIRCNSRVAGFRGGERLSGVICDDGLVEADVALIGVGAVPNAELAEAAGLRCDDGIVVDAYCRTADGAIFAAGDCTNHYNPLLGRRLRLESVQNAIGQARAAALNMCGDEQPYAEVPWFWSQQYEFKLQSAGVRDGHDEIEERGSPEGGAFAVLYRKTGALVAIDAVNMPREYMLARKTMTEQGAPASTTEAAAAGQRAA